MTAEKTPHPADADDPLDRAVLQYTYRVGGGEEIDLGEYCLEYPAAMREELRTRCEQADQLRETLRRGSGSSHPPGEDRPIGPGQIERIGKYEMIREIGSGNMGTVFLARCTETGQEVAVKALPFTPSVSSRMVQRFRREMVAASKLSHPGIVKFLEVGEDRGILFMVMEFIEGASLEELLDRAAKGHAAGGSGELDLPTTQGIPTSPVARVVQIIAGVAEALHHAHQRGVIHRDVKPANIMIDRAGRPRLLDFGLAKDLAEISLSTRGDLAGTPAYMSPEQAMSKQVTIDHRTDIFSLGVVFYEMLARHRPFAGDTLQRLFYEITFKQPEPLRRLRPDLPRDAITICEKAISKDPDHRFPNAGEMVLDLRRFLNHESIVARPVGAVRKWYRRARGRPVTAALAATLAAVLMIAPLVLWWWGRHERLVHALENVRPLLEIEEYALEGSPAVWEALIREAELRQLDPSPDSEAGRAIAELQRKRLSLAKRMEDFVNTPASEESSWLSSEVWVARSVRCRMLAPMLRRGELGAPDVSVALTSRLSVTSNPPGAEVFLQALSRLDGRRLERWKVGRTPLEGCDFEPGLLRIILKLEGHGSAELTRDLAGFGADHEFHVELIEDAKAREGMLEIEEKPFTFGTGSREENWPYHEREMTVKAFLADQDEVSNADYLRFMNATGAAAPAYWPYPDDERDWDSKPVVGVTRKAAQAYAEWAGKRLPTVAEWQRMTRGTEGLIYPEEVDLGKGELPDFEEYAMCRGPIPDWGTTEEEHKKSLDALFEVLDPVGREGAPTGPEGLVHTLGNVSEWTESYSPDIALSGRIVTRDGLAILMGGWWSCTSHDFVDVGESPTDLKDNAQGFRCVKSVDP